jgi:transposase InsO family protein
MHECERPQVGRLATFNQTSFHSSVISRTPRLNSMKQYNVIHVPETITVKSLVSMVPDEVIDDGKSLQDDDVILPLDGNSDPVVSLSVDDVSHHDVDESRDLSDVVVSDALRSADFITLRNEQLADPALSKYWDFARNEKGGLFIRDGLLYRHGYVNGEKVIQLCLPETRVSTVLKLAHDIPFGSHMAFRRTNDRISLSFSFPGQRARVKDHCMRCETCQLFAPARRSDLNVIEPIPRDASPFGHLVLDYIGPFGESGRFKCAFVITDLNTRFPMAYALTNITAKRICDCLIEFFSIFSMPTAIHCDRGTNFTSSPMQLLLQRLGCAPRFNSSYHPQSSGLVERTNATLKNIISKLAASFPRSWETILPFALWSLRMSVNETLGISPYRAAFDRSPIGPLQILREAWIGKRELPLDLVKQPREYLQKVEDNWRISQEYASQHAAKAQKRYADYYNAKSSQKQFEVGEQVIYLSPNSTRKMFSH